MDGSILLLLVLGVGVVSVGACVDGGVDVVFVGVSVGVVVFVVAIVVSLFCTRLDRRVD